ncbi:MAG: 50S ribosomal protein L3 [Candidatus Marinimicrobia bacterium]|nr:50S ribosomal protein L3 [Candidatus Neomarinimicrobiota bacterium]|tara:strand:+ start:28 stop:636 length:609 start_codon:yes stop_codon:yes gene_type:complete
MLIGKKMGMTRLFDEDGLDYPVTVIEAGPCVVTQLKTVENDGYDSMQVGYLDLPENKIKKPMAGHLKKSKTMGKRYLKEFPVLNKEIKCGSKICVDSVQVGDYVDVVGVSKGRGFAGVMKRHGFGGGRRSHGKNSVMRSAGSVGAGSDPSRIWKGKRMAGRFGTDTVTVRNLIVVRIDLDNNQLFIKGAVPGPKNGIIYINK